MPKASAPKVAAAAPQPQKVARSTVRVTYKPLNAADAPFITWNKIKFLANVPVELDPKNRAHGYEIPMPVERPGADGEVRTKHVEKWTSMIEIAKGNPAFEVEGCVRAKAKKSKRVVPPAGHEWADQHEDEIYEEEAEAA